MFFPQLHDSVGNANSDWQVTRRLRDLAVTSHHRELDPSSATALVDVLRLRQWFPTN